MKTLLTLVTAIFVMAAPQLQAQDLSDQESIKTVLSNFEKAIVENDSKIASSLLHEDVTILEGRGSETKEEYLSHHFHSDGKFLSATERNELSQKINIEGNMAWVSTITSMKGTYSDREIDLTSLELAVLKKENGNWKIVALHWSSR
ncbi:MAG: nuclear transport factor 2 family protein [Balneolaceae bacterium]|nr:nuclear transport factor 2 family protein [Balneolaceae bacterium]MBO6545105.1 nuclear transport factor 2 family protein [Balneolaceae bacterium]MBO6646501.1 nuclear transport factor 2 family protein [Balneolaceae bacterium]